MIELKFDIKSFYYDKSSAKFSYVEYKNETIKFKEELMLKDVFKYIYMNYGIEKDAFYKSTWYTKFDLNVSDYNEFFWEQYFDKNICYNLKYAFNDYKNKTLIELENQFNISKFKFPILLNFQGQKGAGIAKKEGIKFFFHTNEKSIHHMPHIHCKYSGEEIRIDLTNILIIDKPFKNKKKSKVALDFCRKYKHELIEYWNKVVINGENMKFELEY